ncbi:MAG: organomercurial lyase, partial [Candidatus Heimdallarchaeota archaeon]
QILDLHIRVLEKIFLQVPFDQIRKSFRTDMEALNYLEIIQLSGHLSFDDNNNLIGAYPVSPLSTDYIISLEGVGTGYSMCAVDALGLPFTFMKKVTITTSDKSTGNKIRIEVDPNSDQRESHNIFVAYQESPDELQGTKSAAIVQCPNIHFYSNKNDIPAKLQIWDYINAFEYSQKRFGRTEMLKRIQEAINFLAA